MALYSKVDIDMPVLCIGEKCKVCPELSIIVKRQEVYAGAGTKPVTVINRIECRHVDKCHAILDLHKESPGG